MAIQPMAEVFGFSIDDLSVEATRHRQHRLCPFNNRIPSCSKDKASDPLGVCSVFVGNKLTITCPIRFRQNWLIATDAAEFFFPNGTHWTSFTEVRVNDANGKSAGNIDVVLVSYDEDGELLDFGAVEIQSVYISGNIRKPFSTYMQSPEANSQLNWQGKRDFPRADFLSSSRKRLAPQLLFKGGILHHWNRKMVVVIDKAFFDELPKLPEVHSSEADVAWFIYDLKLNDQDNRHHLTHIQSVYTQFTPVLRRITNPDPGPEDSFRKMLQRKLKEKTKHGVSTNNTPIDDLFIDDTDQTLMED